ncbi:hypothetical protein SK128_001203, partial [Halocaridina rubra]
TENVCIPGSNYKNVCGQQCLCQNNGVPLCEQTICDEDFEVEGQQCSDYTYFKKDRMNWCRCEFGVTTCTDHRHCQQHDIPFLSPIFGSRESVVLHLLQSMASDNTSSTVTSSTSTVSISKTKESDLITNLTTAATVSQKVAEALAVPRNTTSDISEKTFIPTTSEKIISVTSLSSSTTKVPHESRGTTFVAPTVTEEQAVSSPLDTLLLISPSVKEEAIASITANDTSTAVSSISEKLAESVTPSIRMETINVTTVETSASATSQTITKETAVSASSTHSEITTKRVTQEPTASATVGSSNIFSIQTGSVSSSSPVTCLSTIPSRVTEELHMSKSPSVSANWTIVPSISTRKLDITTASASLSSSVVSSSESHKSPSQKEMTSKSGNITSPEPFATSSIVTSASALPAATKILTVSSSPMVTEASAERGTVTSVSSGKSYMTQNLALSGNVSSALPVSKVITSVPAASKYATSPTTILSSELAESIIVPGVIDKATVPPYNIQASHTPQNLANMSITTAIKTSSSTDFSYVSELLGTTKATAVTDNELEISTMVSSLAGMTNVINATTVSDTVTYESTVSQGFTETEAPENVTSAFITQGILTETPKSATAKSSSDMSRRVTTAPDITAPESQFKTTAPTIPPKLTEQSVSATGALRTTKVSAVTDEDTSTSTLSPVVTGPLAMSRNVSTVPGISKTRVTEVPAVSLNIASATTATPSDLQITEIFLNKTSVSARSPYHASVSTLPSTVTESSVASLYVVADSESSLTTGKDLDSLKNITFPSMLSSSVPDETTTSATKTSIPFTLLRTKSPSIPVKTSYTSGVITDAPSVLPSSTAAIATAKLSPNMTDITPIETLSTTSTRVTEISKTSATASSIGTTATASFKGTSTTASFKGPATAALSTERSTAESSKEPSITASTKGESTTLSSKSTSTTISTTVIPKTSHLPYDADESDRPSKRVTAYPKSTPTYTKSMVSLENDMLPTILSINVSESTTPATNITFAVNASAYVSGTSTLRVSRSTSSVLPSVTHTSLTPTVLHSSTSLIKDAGTLTTIVKNTSDTAELRNITTILTPSSKLSIAPIATTTVSLSSIAPSVTKEENASTAIDVLSTASHISPTVSKEQATSADVIFSLPTSPKTMEELHISSTNITSMTPTMFRIIASTTSPNKSDTSVSVRDINIPSSTLLSKTDASTTSIDISLISMTKPSTANLVSDKTSVTDSIAVAEPPSSRSPKLLNITESSVTPTYVSPETKLSYRNTDTPSISTISFAPSERETAISSSDAGKDVSESTVLPKMTETLTAITGITPVSTISSRTTEVQDLLESMYPTSLTSPLVEEKTVASENISLENMASLSTIKTSSVSEADTSALEISSIRETTALSESNASTSTASHSINYITPYVITEIDVPVNVTESPDVIAYMPATSTISQIMKVTASTSDNATYTQSAMPSVTETQQKSDEEHLVTAVPQPKTPLSTTSIYAASTSSSMAEMSHALTNVTPESTLASDEIKSSTESDTRPDKEILSQTSVKSHMESPVASTLLFTLTESQDISAATVSVNATSIPSAVTYMTQKHSTLDKAASTSAVSQTLKEMSTKSTISSMGETSLASADLAQESTTTSRIIKSSMETKSLPVLEMLNQTTATSYMESSGAASLPLTVTKLPDELDNVSSTSTLSPSMKITSNVSIKATSIPFTTSNVTERQSKLDEGTFTSTVSQILTEMSDVSKGVSDESSSSLEQTIISRPQTESFDLQTDTTKEKDVFTTKRAVTFATITTPEESLKGINVSSAASLEPNLEAYVTSETLQLLSTSEKPDSSLSSTALFSDEASTLVTNAPSIFYENATSTYISDSPAKSMLSSSVSFASPPGTMQTQTIKEDTAQAEVTDHSTLTVLQELAEPYTAKIITPSKHDEAVTESTLLTSDTSPSTSLPATNVQAPSTATKSTKPTVAKLIASTIIPVGTASFVPFKSSEHTLLTTEIPIFKAESSSSTALHTKLPAAQTAELVKVPFATDAPLSTTTAKCICPPVVEETTKPKLPLPPPPTTVLYQEIIHSCHIMLIYSRQTNITNILQ